MYLEKQLSANFTIYSLALRAMGVTGIGWLTAV
jgi:hypothetical protein